MNVYFRCTYFGYFYHSGLLTDCKSDEKTCNEIRTLYKSLSCKDGGKYAILERLKNYLDTAPLALQDRLIFSCRTDFGKPVLFVQIRFLYFQFITCSMYVRKFKITRPFITLTKITVFI